MEEQLTYLGITFDKESLKTFEELGFIKEEFGDDIFFVSPKMTHSLPVYGKNYYKPYIFSTTNEDGEEVDADFYIAYIIPDMELIHDSKFKELQGLYGWDDKSIEEVREAMTYYDVVREYGVCLGSELIPSEGEWKYSIV